MIADLSEKQISELQEAHKTLTETIKEYGNGVWAWYLRNQLAPSVIKKRKVDRIVSNPPWLPFSEIQVQKRKEEILGKAKEWKIWQGGQNAGSFDIASLFVVETRKLYLKESGRVKSAYVLNHAALKTKTWEKFRKIDKGKHKRGALSLLSARTEGKTLRESPYNTAESCVVGMTRSGRLVLKPEQRIKRKENWEVVREKIEIIDVLELPNNGQGLESTYRHEPKSGARIAPHVLLRVDPDNSSKTLQSKRAKGRWKELKPMELKDIPPHWIKEFIDSSHLVPFGVKPQLAKAIVPTDPKTGEMLSSEQALEASETWRILDGEYRRHKGIGKTTPQTLLDRIKYQNLWDKQFPLQEAVYYPASGSRMCAAVGTYPTNDKIF